MEGTRLPAKKKAESNRVCVGFSPLLAAIINRTANAATAKIALSI